MFGGETNQLIGNGCDDRQKNDAQRKFGPEPLDRERCINEDADQHDRHQKAGAAAGMVGGILLRLLDGRHAVVFESEYRLMLTTVVVVNPLNVFEERNAPYEE